LHTFQKAVFEDSLTGPWVKNHLGFVLLDPTAAEEKDSKGRPSRR
jgi:hypothetical protein